MMQRQESSIRISLVVAMDRNNTIGKDGRLPWKISDDLKRFRAVTTGKPVVMGRRTFESIGRPLPDRDNIVITGNAAYAACGVSVVHSPKAGVALAGRYAQRRKTDEMCIIGGAQIYVLFLHLASRIYLTRVEGEIDGDVRFPGIEPGEWTEHHSGGCSRDRRNEFACRFSVLERRQ